MAPVPFATPVIMLLLAIAAITALRRRQVPTWVTLGGSGAGLLVAAATGWEAPQVSLLGLVVGGVLLLPFVPTSGFSRATRSCWRRWAPGRAGSWSTGRPGGQHWLAPVWRSWPGDEDSGRSPAFRPSPSVPRLRS